MAQTWDADGVPPPGTTYADMSRDQRAAFVLEEGALGNVDGYLHSIHTARPSDLAHGLPAQAAGFRIPRQPPGHASQMPYDARRGLIQGAYAAVVRRPVVPPAPGHLHFPESNLRKASGRNA